MAQPNKYNTKIEALSLTYERELISKWQTSRDQRSLRILLEAHKPFITKMARTYARGRERQDDLINDGYIAFIETIDKFKPQNETRFVSYARSFVRSALLSRSAEMDLTISIPREKLSSVTSGRSSKEAFDRIKALTNSISLDEKPEHVPAAQDLCVLDVISKNQTISIWKESLKEAFEKLTDEERNVMSHRLSGTDVNVKEIAEQTGKTPSRVRAIEQRAMKRLRNALIEQGFTPTHLVTT